MYTAVLLEPRAQMSIPFVIKNALNTLSANWSVLFIHGKNNSDFATQVLSNFDKNDLSRIVLKDGGFNLLNHSAHSNFLRSEQFYELIPTETHRLFQTDSVFCEEYKDLIGEFMEYDYVGAPWPFPPEVGNGGFSLRKKSKMIAKIQQCDLVLDSTSKQWEPEDMWFSNPCVNGNVTLHKPGREEAKRFSNEYYLTDVSFGCHKLWQFHTRKLLNGKFPHCKALWDLMKIYMYI